MSSHSMSFGARKFPSLRLASAMAAALFFVSAGPAQAQDYTVSTSPIGFTSISATGTALKAGFVDLNGAADLDDGFQDIAAPFDFDFFGTTVTMGDLVRVHANGLVTPGGMSTSDQATVSALNNAIAEDNTIFVCWSDLDLTNSGEVFQEVQGTAPNRTWIIEYSMIPGLAPSTAVIDAQLSIAETSGVIELRYSATNDFAGDQFVLGAKNANGQIARGFPVSTIQTLNPTDNGVLTPSAGFPNLVVSNVTVSASSVQAGDVLSVMFDIENTGVNDSTNFDVQVFLSLDSGIDTNDQAFTGTPLSLQLNVGAMQSATAMATVPVPNPTSMNGRQYFVGVFADPTNAQNDPNVSDNTGSTAILVGPEPYLVRFEPQISFSSILGQAGTTVLASDQMTPRDDGEVAGTLPFAFNYYGQSFPANTPLAIGYNGYVEINDSVIATGGGFSNSNLPSTATQPDQNVLYPFWDDLNLASGFPNSISEQTTGTAPNRIYIVEFNRLERRFGDGAGYTFQVEFRETVNSIRFIYDPSLPLSGIPSGTVGIEGPNNSEAIQLSPNGGFGTGNFAVRPAMNVLFVENGNQAITTDLTASAVSVAQTMVNAGAAIDVTRTVGNIGTTDSGMIDVAFVLSTDQIIDASDLIINSDSIMNVAAGGNVMLTTAVSLPVTVPPGTYFVGVIANTANSFVAESDYFNNDASTMTAITVAGPSKDEGDINDDDLVNIVDVMANINFLLTDPTNPLGDVNNDAVSNIFDVQITINRVLAAP